MDSGQCVTSIPELESNWSEDETPNFTPPMSKFIITRKDQEIDQIVIESEGLTMGRLTGNDLVLNHPTVSRTHAGIKEVSGDYWIFNLSQANGTLINGEQVDST